MFCTEKIFELKENIFVIPNSTNVGVILSFDNERKNAGVFLIDSGCTEIDGEYILDVLNDFFAANKDISFLVKAIFTTHAHADHCGAHNFIKENTNCIIYSPFSERGNMENPVVLSSFLWGGYPPHELRTHFFQADPVFPDEVVNPDSVIELSDERKITFIELPGHSHGHFGIILNCRDKSKILFSGDALFTREEIARHWIPLIVNPNEFMNSLDKICSIENLSYCVPSHGKVISGNIEETAELDKIAILTTKECILEALNLNDFMTAEQIIKYVAKRNSLNMNLSQYALISSTIKSYIAVLHDERKLRMKVEDNTLLFYKPPVNN